MTQDYELFKEKWFGLTGINLSLYKEEQMKRRLNTLRVKRGMANFTDYFNLLSESKDCFSECLERITINVTEFYRNRPRWEIFETKLLPLLLKERRGASRPFTVWSAACSSGEEPYTLSFLLSKYLAPKDFLIYATDIDQTILKQAAQGRYHERSLVNMNDNEKKAYFHQEDALYILKDSYKESIHFKHHNLLKDPPPAAFDLIVCRNVLIYFTEEAKTLVYSMFSKALSPNGLLFVGSTEQIFRPEQHSLVSVDTFFYGKSPLNKGSKAKVR